MKKVVLFFILFLSLDCYSQSINSMKDIDVSVNIIKGKDVKSVIIADTMSIASLINILELDTTDFYLISGYIKTKETVLISVGSSMVKIYPKFLDSDKYYSYDAPDTKLEDILKLQIKGIDLFDDREYVSRVEFNKGEHKIIFSRKN